jgi:hypothetical protein
LCQSRLQAAPRVRLNSAGARPYESQTGGRRGSRTRAAATALATAKTRHLPQRRRKVLADGNVSRQAIAGGLMAAEPERGRRFGGLTLGGIIVIVGIVLMIVWSFWIGLIVALIGLIAFGGFVRGKWY